MTHKIKGGDVEKYAYYFNRIRQSVGLETWKWRQVVTLQTAHTKYIWPLYDPQPKHPHESTPLPMTTRTEFIVLKVLWNAKNFETVPEILHFSQENDQG